MEPSGTVAGSRRRDEEEEEPQQRLAMQQEILSMGGGLETPQRNYLRKVLMTPEDKFAELYMTPERMKLQEELLTTTSALTMDTTVPLSPSADAGEALPFDEPVPAVASASAAGEALTNNSGSTSAGNNSSRLFKESVVVVDESPSISAVEDEDPNLQRQYDLLPEDEVKEDIKNSPKKNRDLIKRPSSKHTHHVKTLNARNAVPRVIESKNKDIRKSMSSTLMSKTERLLRTPDAKRIISTNEAIIQEISTELYRDEEDTHMTTDPPPIYTSLRESVLPGESKRAHYPLRLSKTALLIIDIQEYLSQPSSPEHAIEEKYFFETSLPRTVRNLQLLVAVMRQKRDSKPQGCNVIFTYLEALTKDNRDISLDYKLSGPKLAKIPNAATAPAKFMPDLMPRPKDGKGDILLPKTSCSVFHSTSLHYILQNLHVEQLVIAGQLTDQCVESAVRDAADLGYFVTLVDDACAAMSDESHRKGLAGCKGFCRTISTVQVLQELHHPDAGMTANNLHHGKPIFHPLGGKTSTIPTVLEMETTTATTEATTAATKDADGCIRVDLLPTSEFKAPMTSQSVIESMHATLQFAGVKFIRFMIIDAYNTVRSKAIPIKRFCWDSTVTIATVCHAGMPPHAGMLVPQSGLDARGVLEVKPDYGTMRILPYSPKTAVILGTSHDVLSAPGSSSGAAVSGLCCRGLLARFIQMAKQSHGITFNVGAELEFCLHDAQSGLPVDHSVFASNTTLDQREEFITNLLRMLEQQSIPIELLHGESGPGQLELVISYSTDPLKLADHVVMARETIQSCAQAHGYRALFLPKIHADKAGNGMHLHLSFATPHNPNAMAGNVHEDELSREGQSFVEGILQHLPALLALSLPSENSFRRVGPGCWTGHQVGWDIEDKEAPLRVCLDVKRKRLSNVEYKLSDSVGNIYLSLACILACGLKGIAKQLKLRPSFLDMEETDKSPSLPKTFAEALNKLESDDFLMRIMGADLGKAYLAVRRAEVKRSSGMTLDEEVAEAWERS